MPIQNNTYQTDTQVNPSLTIEEIEHLRTPFQLDQHRFDMEWPYLTEFYITRRIEEVDPAWSWVIHSIDRRESGTRGEMKVTVHGSLTIKDVTRDGIGQAIIRQTGMKTNKETGETWTNEANSAEKSAATDAFKRAARLFGVGRYLLKTQEKKIKTREQLWQWLEKVSVPEANGHNGA